MSREERLEYLGQIAAWYYEDHLDQTEIARRIGKSRSMVSRLLHEAREAGLVEIRVRFPLRTDNELEERLVAAFGLSEARVLTAESRDWETGLRSLGRLGAVALQRSLRSDINIVVGWGAALHSVVRAMPGLPLEGVMVLQVMGSVGDGDPNVDGSDLARTLASKLNGDFRYLAAPVIVSSEETARSLLADRTIANTLSLAREAEVALTGIGSIDTRLSGLLRAGYFDDQHLAELRNAGVVGDLMGYLLDADGRVLDIEDNRRVVALHPDDLKRVQTVIGVAGGVAKAAAILAVLRAGYLDVLVTDSVAAREVLRLHASQTLVQGRA